MPKVTNSLLSEKLSGESVVKAVTDLSEQILSNAGSALKDTLFHSRREIPAALTSPFVLHSQEAFVIHQGPIESLAGFRGTRLPFALISINQIGTYRTPVLHHVTKMEILNGDVIIQSGEGAVLLDKNNTARDFAQETGSYILTVAGLGFGQILISNERAQTEPLNPLSRPFLGNSLNEPIVAD